VEESIDFSVKDVADFSAPDKSGIMISNPPYGERIGDREGIERIYGTWRRFFAENPCWSLFCLTSDKTVEDQIFGRPANRRRKLYNGRMEVCYYQFHGERPKREDLEK
jgi:putative N6-adenine-specific DNA methylase